MSQRDARTRTTALEEQQAPRAELWTRGPRPTSARRRGSTCGLSAQQVSLTWCVSLGLLSQETQGLPHRGVGKLS